MNPPVEAVVEEYDDRPPRIPDLFFEVGLQEIERGLWILPGANHPVLGVLVRAACIGTEVRSGRGGSAFKKPREDWVLPGANHPVLGVLVRAACIGTEVKVRKKEEREREGFKECVHVRGEREREREESVRM